ncbi:MAG: thioredoxin family protein [bacterium]|nr:thioredoxin family protein [bacterium]
MKNKFLIQGLVAVFLLLILPVLVVAEEPTENESKRPSIPWQKYHGARATAKAESKPIMLHFTNEWCSGCKKMDKITYQNFEVMRYLQENFSCGWVNIENERSLAKKYKVDGLPTLWFLDSKGKALTSVDGYISPERLLLILEYLNTKAYKSMSYEKWKEKHPRR